MKDENEQRKGTIRAAFQEEQPDVELLPAREDLTDEHKENAIIRVAAYCRVSTLSEMQAESFEIQQQYYNELIARHPNWELVDIYADEGISATSVKNRKSFNRMIDDCREGKIDLIITKSVSRFARNVVDCIDTARNLKKLVPPVGVLFETENINTIDQNGELLLTVLAAFAQDESVNKSISVAWGFRQRFAKGIVKMRKVYGYTVVGNRLEVVEKEFRIVQEIYRLYLHGKSTGEITKILTEQRVPTPTGRAKWTASTVGYIIGNDKNAGDVIMQKTYCVDLFSHKRVRNYGKVQRYRKSNTHTPAISRDLWRKAKNRLMLSHREVEIVEEPAGDGWRKGFHRIRFKDDIDVIQTQGPQ